MFNIFRLQSGDGILQARALLGNETWLREQGARTDQDFEQLHSMKSHGKSVVLLALENTSLPGKFSTVAVFAISDKIRPEAPSVISQLHAQEIETWMISGDNAITAQAVARSVGIPSENVIAGVLPQQKVWFALKLNMIEHFNQTSSHRQIKSAGSSPCLEGTSRETIMARRKAEK